MAQRMTRYVTRSGGTARTRKVTDGDRRDVAAWKRAQDDARNERLATPAERRRS